MTNDTLFETDEISLRSWLHSLQQAGELHSIDSLVDWDQELAAISRVSLGQQGPGLLFKNIKDYEDADCSRVVTGVLSKTEHVALLLGLSKETSSQDIVTEIRRRYRQPVTPILVETGPVKENVLKGKDIDLFDLPVPLWHYTDGGRYIDTFSTTFTKDPETQVTNVGIYRGQILDKNKIGKVIGKLQGWGQHFVKRGIKAEPMPVAIVYGWHDALTMCGATSFDRTVSELDMVGGLLQQPVELVKCETVDLEVPATAELVIEGLISPDPQTFENEGPFCEYHGYQGGAASPKPVIQVTAITYRNQPILRAGMEGCRPGFPSEDMASFNHSLVAVLMNYMENIGVVGVTDLHLVPVTSGTHVVVQINKQHRGQVQQIASALWARSIGQMVFKQVTVVEQDIDIRNPEAVEWAVAYRCDATNGGLTTYGPTAGSLLDPSVAPEVRNPMKYGAGRWTRVVIDATRNWDFDPGPDGRRFPEVYRLPVALEQKVHDRWTEYGIDVDYPDQHKREVLTLRETLKRMPEV